MLIGSHIYITNDHPILAILVIILSLYGAFENLFRKRISLFGFDRLIYFLGILINKRQANKAMKNPVNLRRLGIMLILIAIGAIINSIEIK